MRTHHAIRPASPGFTGGGDEVRAKCEGRWGVFDRLIDREHGPANQRDLLEAWALCNECPLRAACHAENADEPWVAVMHGRPRRVQQVSDRTMTDEQRNRIAETNRRRLAEKNAEREVLLRELIDNGATFAEILAALSIGRASFHHWCKNHGHMDMYREVAPGRGAPGVKRGVA